MINVYTNTMMKRAIILFAHGARDPRWKEPLIKVKELIQISHEDVQVELAFLELMKPSLEDVIHELNQRNFHTITLVPVFLGQGGHIREDLPKLIDACRHQYPLLNLTVKTAVGEDIGVLQAIAKYCADQ